MYASCRGLRGVARLPSAGCDGSPQRVSVADAAAAEPFKRPPPLPKRSPAWAASRANGGGCCGRRRWRRCTSRRTSSRCYVWRSSSRPARGELSGTGLMAMTALEDRFGLSPKSRRALQWEIGQAERDAPSRPVEAPKLYAVRWVSGGRFPRSAARSGCGYRGIARSGRRAPRRAVPAHRRAVGFPLRFYALDARGRFVYPRGGILVRPTKWGKSPLAAALVAAEAAGPTRFDRWADDGSQSGGRTRRRGFRSRPCRRTRRRTPGTRSCRCCSSATSRTRSTTWA